jgi:hypothetical protein
MPIVMRFEAEGLLAWLHIVPGAMAATPAVAAALFTNERRESAVNSEAEVTGSFISISTQKQMRVKFSTAGAPQSFAPGKALKPIVKPT